MPVLISSQGSSWVLVSGTPEPCGVGPFLPGPGVELLFLPLTQWCLQGPQTSISCLAAGRTCSQQPIACDLWLENMPWGGKLVARCRRAGLGG